MDRNTAAVLLTGVTGYVGALLAAALLHRDKVHLVLPVRPGHDRESALGPLRLELAALDSARIEDLERRVTLLTLPPMERLDDLAPVIRPFGIKEIIHCAGCVDYFDTARLQTTNVDFTRRLLALSAHLDVQRFVYLSTAYSCGYRNGTALEALHTEPDADPTEYTRTKRQAEHLVADSGIPYLIVRPSIVIGDSRSGRYSGKRYGLYQQLMGLERLLCDRYHEEFHVVAPPRPINFVHQNILQDAFLHAWRSLPHDSILHLTSRNSTAPSMRDLWSYWLRTVSRPHRIYYYRHLADVPLQGIHPRQKAYLMFASVNLDIAAHHWRFATDHLERLRAEGLDFQDATLDSVTFCQQRFIRSSRRIQDFITTNARRMPASSEVIDMTAHGSVGEPTAG